MVGVGGGEFDGEPSETVFEGGVGTSNSSGGSVGGGESSGRGIWRRRGERSPRPPTSGQPLSEKERISFNFTLQYQEKHLSPEERTLAGSAGRARRKKKFVASL
jgi:hypothetical protein